MKKWLTISDADVVHIWAAPDGKNEVDIPPTFYAESGTPVCAESGDDMIYVRTEVSPRIAEALKFQKAVEPILQHFYDVMYWDDDKDCFDPDKEWSSANDFMEHVAFRLRLLYGTPTAGSTKYPKLK